MTTRRFAVLPAPVEPAPDARLLKPREVAERLSVSERKVYAWIADGTLPSVDLPGRIRRVPAHALDAWIADNTRPGRA